MINAPRKCEIFGVQVSATTYAEVIRFVLDRAKARAGTIIDLMPVHGLMTAARDFDYRSKINAFDVVAPDGQPVRWSLNKLHNAALSDRVYGPELMRKLCHAAADEGVSVYLYGSSEEVIARLQAKLMEWCPTLKISGAESPPFRPLSKQETAEAIERMNASGAGIVFLGTGCPRQETFAHANRDAIHAVQLCVGAAFDFHAGVKRMAPPWMQKRGLEWLFRLVTEPRRLWKRYLVTNTLFLTYFAGAILAKLLSPGEPSADDVEAGAALSGVNQRS